MTDLEQVAASHGFTAVKSEPISEVEGTVHLMHHAASGARLMFIENDDANKAFSITFKTPAADDTGVFHILEHSVLCGSEKFPVKEPFVNLLKTSMQTFLNAMTFPDKTMYPVASTNEQDLVNLMDVYLDAVFHPDIYRRPVIFQQEGWHRELEGEGEGERLVVNGVVYNEMKGALSEPDSVLYDGLSAALFPDTTYRFESGGTPAAIPTLTYEGFLENHRRHYRPDNAYIILYGNLDADRFLGFLDERYLAPLAAKERGPLDINPLGLQAPVAPAPVVVPMATAPENACAAVGFVIGRAAERERIVAADILMDAIMGANESPLKRALLDAGIADDAIGYVADSVAQPFAVVSLRGARPGAAECAARHRCEAEARRLAEGGLDRELVRAALSHAEFVMRERNFGYPDGVVLAMSAMAGWLYSDDDPAAYLRFEDVFASLREKVEEGYFEALLRELFLDNDHRACAEVVPTESDEAAEEAEAAGEREAAAALTRGRGRGHPRGRARAARGPGGAGRAGGPRETSAAFAGRYRRGARRGDVGGGGVRALAPHPPPSALPRHRLRLPLLRHGRPRLRRAALRHGAGLRARQVGYVPPHGSRAGHPCPGPSGQPRVRRGSARGRREPRAAAPDVRHGLLRP